MPWVILAITTNTRRTEIEEDIICCTRRRGSLPKYILGLVSVITVISSYLEFKGYSAVGRLNCLVQKLICGTQISNGVVTPRPKQHTYKDHVYLDRLFLMSNLTWRRAHVTAGLTGRDPNVKVNVLRRFH